MKLWDILLVWLLVWLLTFSPYSIIAVSENGIFSFDFSKNESYALSPTPGWVGNTGLGTITDPFTSMSAAYGVTTEWIYHFDIGGQTFSTFVEANNGWILVGSWDGNESGGSYTQSNTITKRWDVMLPAATVAALSDRTELRIYAETGANANTVDARSTDANVLASFDAYQFLWEKNGIDVESQWIGTGVSTFMSGGGNSTYTPNALNDSIMHLSGNTTGMHWIPNGNFEKVNNSQVGGTGFNLWVRSANTNNLTLWFKADEGVSLSAGTTISEWESQAGQNSGLTLEAGGLPGVSTLDDDGANFNPTVQIPANGNLQLKGGPVFGDDLFSATDNTIFFVKKYKAGVVEAGYGFSGNQRAGYFEVSGGNQRTDFGATNVISSVSPANRYLIAESKTNASSVDLIIDGKTEATGSPATFDIFASTQFSLGSTVNDTLITELDVAEYIVYKDDLSLGDRQQIQSYLALKYGITLDSSIGDYLDSTGGSVYDLSSGYENDVVGIANDIDSSLDQAVFSDGS